MAQGTLPRLSVIIAHRDRRELLRACLQSLLGAREHLNMEAIVVDNASSDGSPALIREEFPWVTLVQNEGNQGYAPAINRGIVRSSGGYLLLLNNDTVVQPGALEALVAFMERTPQAGACGPRLLFPDGALQPSGEPFPTVWSVLLSELTRFRWDRRKYFWRGRDFDQVSEVDALSGACLLARRSALDAVGSLDEGFFFYFEDIDWCYRLKGAGWKVYYVPQATVVHHWGASRPDHLPLVLREGRRSQLYFFRKHHGPWALLALKLILGCSDLVGLLRSLALVLVRPGAGSRGFGRLALRAQILGLTLRYPWTP